MRNLQSLLYLLCFLTFFNAVSQELLNTFGNVPLNYKKRSPIYDYSELQLNPTDTIPDFETKPNKLKISGTIFLSDKITPAKDVLLYIYQPDEDGNYVMKKDGRQKRYVYHRGWIKTDADGRYTFYTFMPGKFQRTKELKQIHRIIKEPGKPEYELNPFFFNDDPLIPDLTLACRAQIVNSMLRIEKEGDMFVATKDIILKKDTSLDQ